MKYIVQNLLILLVSELQSSEACTCVKNYVSNQETVTNLCAITDVVNINPAPNTTISMYALMQNFLCSKTDGYYFISLIAA